MIKAGNDNYTGGVTLPRADGQGDLSVCYAVVLGDYWDGFVSVHNA